jgi:hypothetical protein
MQEWNEMIEHQQYCKTQHLKVEDITICIESCWKMGVGREGVRESNGRGWMDQGKVDSQWGTLKLDWILT